MMPLWFAEIHNGRFFSSDCTGTTSHVGLTLMNADTGLFQSCMIHQVADHALLTVMFFLHNACFPALKMDTLWTSSLPEQQAGFIFEINRNLQHCLQCTLLPSISNHSSTVAYMIGPTFTSLELKWDSVRWSGVLPVLLCAIVQRPVGWSIWSLAVVEKKGGDSLK